MLNKEYEQFLCIQIPHMLIMHNYRAMIKIRKLT